MVEAARRRARAQRSLFGGCLAPLRRRAAPARRVSFARTSNALPFAGVTFDLVWSNLALQWVNDLPRAFAELRRVLRSGGLFIVHDVRAGHAARVARGVRAASTRHTHMNRFVDMHDIGDMLVAAGFADPVMDMEYVTLTFESPAALLRELKAIGATNATRGRPRGLTGRARFARVAARAREAARQRAHSGDVRGGLRPRVEGRAAQRRRRGTRSCASRARERMPRGDLSADRRMRGLFITGTDTGVGKTRVAVALLRALRGRGHARGRHEAGRARASRRSRRVNADVAALAAAGGVDAPLDDRNPYAFAERCAPHLAAEAGGVSQSSLRRSSGRGAADWRARTR